MFRRLLIIAFMVFGAASNARAGSVKLLADSSEVHLGVPFQLAIDVTASKDHQAPEFPELNGATAVLVNTSTNSRSSRIIINGRQVGSSEETTRYLYHVTPTKEGVLQIPRIELVVDGERVYTRASNFRVTKSEKGDLLFVELIGERERVYVGESIDVTLRVWLKEYKRGRTKLNYREMWQAIDKSATNWGVFEDLVSRPNPDVQIGQSQRIGDDGIKQSYLVYELSTKMWPTRSGELSAGNVRIVVDYPIQVTRDVFGSVRFSQSKPIFATVEETNVEVLDIPSEGRPAGYAGAVGGHSIEASASPQSVRVGDPITLNITVKGESQLEHLQAPRLSEVPGFNEHFQIGDDTLPGVVKNNGKTFSLSLRALSDDVTEIPSIPLPFFDTNSETFKTAYSKPIPLEVAPARKMSNMQIVQSGEPTKQTESTLTRLGGGIEANRSDLNRLLANQGATLSPVGATVIVGSPLIFAACLLVRRRKEDRRVNSKRFIQRAAYKTAQSRLGDIQSSGGATGPAGTPLAVLLSYVGDRLGIDGEGLTRGEAVGSLVDAGVAADMTNEVDRVIATCEAAEFGGTAGHVDSNQIASVRACVEQIERALSKRR